MWAVAVGEQVQGHETPSPVSTGELTDGALIRPRMPGSDDGSNPCSAHELFGPIAKSLTGRALTDDDPPTSRAIQELFELRNAIAHRAAEPADRQRAEVVAAVRTAFVWLDGPPDQSAR